MNTSFKLLSMVLSSLAVVGCVAGVEPESVAAAQGAVETENSLTVNSLTVNSLTVNSLTVNSLLTSALTDSASRTVFTYIVGCALPEGVHLDLEIEGTTYGYDGQLGLAPGWGQAGGSCDAACQARISSCVIARLNYYGQVVPLSARGAGLSTTAAEESEYPTRDAVYFGNVFTSPQERYACLPPGGSLTRVCGPAGAPPCEGVTHVGPCDSLCDPAAADGSYANCHAGAGGALFGEPISVYLH